MFDEIYLYNTKIVNIETFKEVSQDLVYKYVENPNLILLNEISIYASSLRSFTSVLLDLKEYLFKLELNSDDGVLSNE